jgi:branched-chain amino acid transport system ATP-binding protein
MKDSEKSIIIETHELTKSFGGLVALNNVNLRIPKGELRAIIGPNGAGKSTLLNTITGRLTPTSGEIYFLGEKITGLPPHEIARRGIALSLQIVQVFPNLSVFDNIWLGVKMRFKTRNPFIHWRQLKVIEEKVIEICKKIGLENKIDEIASNLSHGDQRLLDIAIALSTNPKLLLLDEPLAGLSVKERRHVSNLIKELSQEKTIILIEHDIDAVMRLADRITVLDRGRVIAEGTPREISEDRQVQEVYIGSRE